MNKLFIPAIAIMQRIKYLQKFALIFILFLIPLAILMQVQVTQINQRLEYSQKQKAGLEYNIALRSLIQQVQQHRGLSSGYLGGKLEQKDKILPKQVQIRGIIETVDKLDVKYGEIMGTKDLWRDLKGRWLQLEREVFSLPLKESTRRHTDLIREMLDLNSHIADISKLLLQERIEGYYLADSVVYKLPLAAEFMGQARATGAGVAAKKTMTKDENFLLLYLTQSINKSLLDTNRGMKTVFEKNPEIKKQLDSSYTLAYEASNSLINRINNEILHTDSITMDSDDYYNFSTKTIDDIYQLINMESDILNQFSNEQISSLAAKRISFLIMTMLALSLIIYLFTGFYLSVRKSLLDIERATVSIAEGNLAVKVSLNTQDETKQIEQSLNTMVQSFANMIRASKRVVDEVTSSTKQLTAITEQTTQATNQITEDIQEVADGAEVQLEATNNTAKAMEEMTSGILHVAETAASVSASSIQTEQQALLGNNVIRSVVTEMTSINDAIHESYTMIQTLGERSQDIKQIVDVITGIAEQTNLLSLNASIEAARAGEHGRGFAVVADEVKKLAELSGKSASNIKELIREILVYTSQSVNNMDKVNQRAQKGLLEATNAGETFQQILAATQNVAMQVQEVSAASEQMSASSQEITATVAGIQDIAKNSTTNTQSVVASSQEQLAAMEEIATSSAALNLKAEELKKIIETFNV